jgi:hypothetical protein
LVIHQAAEALRVTVLVARALDQLGVPHAIVGSLASSLHGVPRSTNDVDIVATLRREHADALASALGDAFYVDSDMIRDAIDRRSEFNVIHLGTMFKVDVFVPALDRVSRAQIDRAAIVNVDSEAGLSPGQKPGRDLPPAGRERARSRGPAGSRPGRVSGRATSEVARSGVEPSVSCALSQVGSPNIRSRPA